MSTHKSTWKRAESAAAALFGARRAILSGSANRDDKCSSDSTHERLFIETKLRAKHAVYRVWDLAKKLAKGKKIPVVVLKEKGRPGCLIVVHEDHFRAVAAEYLAAMDEDALLATERDVRVLRIGEDDA